VKITLFAFLLTFQFCARSATAQGSRPVPPGLHQADKAVRQGEASIPPPQESRTSIDFAKIRHDADELSALAQSIPTDIDRVSKGMLPKDMVEKLKRIEKISKHLRGELAP
jgi:HAMP domain-containing protein